MKASDARKAWAAAIAASLGLHVLIFGLIVRDWSMRMPARVEQAVEITLERPQPPPPLPDEERATANPGVTPLSPRRTLATDAEPFLAPTERAPPPVQTPAPAAPPAATPAPGSGVDLKAFAYPGLPGCGDLTLEQQRRRRDCEVAPIVEARPLQLPLPPPNFEAGMPPKSTPGWERAAAERKRWEVYKNCKNYDDCAAKNPGVRSLIGRIFGD